MLSTLYVITRTSVRPEILTSSPRPGTSNKCGWENKPFSYVNISKTAGHTCRVVDPQADL